MLTIVVLVDCEAATDARAVVACGSPVVPKSRGLGAEGIATAAIGVSERPRAVIQAAAVETLVAMIIPCTSIGVGSRDGDTREAWKFTNL